MSGFDTAAFVYDVWQEAVAQFGTPNFWIRYFSPSQTTPINVSSSNACEECLAMWQSGGHYLGPISFPPQSNLSGTTADGQADAQTFANAMQTVYYDVLPLLLPSNNELYCWLDQEHRLPLVFPIGNVGQVICATLTLLTSDRIPYIRGCTAIPVHHRQIVQP